MKKHLVIFHPAIAPYRIDFFNSLNEAYKASFYIEFKNPLEQSFNQDKIKSRLKFNPRYLKPGFAGIKNLRFDVLGILRRENPDMVFISEYNLLGLLVVLYKLITFSRFRIVTICDDNLLMVQTAGFLKRLTRGVLLRFLYAVILADKKAYMCYENKWGKCCKWIYFPIIQSEIEFRASLQEALPLTATYREKYALQGKKVILYVGRLAAVKNVSLLLRAFQKVEQKNKDTALLIVGDGPLREELHQECVRLSLENAVVFAGKQEGRELMAHYNLGDLFVLTSRYEPFGTVVNEALLAGCFVLCSNKAGASCLIEEGGNGKVFDINDEVTLVDIILQQLEIIPALNKSNNLKINRMNICYDELFFSLLQKLMNKN